jgi:hypothetical protein
VNESFLDIVAAAPKRTVRIGDTLHVHIGEDAFESLEAKIQRALRHGLTVEENGVSRWITDSPVFDSTKSGSAAYTWKNDKIKVEHILVTKSKDGTITRQSAGFVWKNWE